jgi:hypothetical protein
MSASGMNSWLDRLRNRGIVAKTAMLTLAVAVVFAAASPVVFHIGGAMGLAAAGLAAALCLLGAATALVVSHLVREPQHALAGLLMATTARMGAPLLIGLVAHLRGGPLAEAGLLYYLLIFYPVTLTVEISMSLPQRRQSAAPPNIPTNTAP